MKERQPIFALAIMIIVAVGDLDNLTESARNLLPFFSAKWKRSGRSH